MASSRRSVSTLRTVNVRTSGRCSTGRSLKLSSVSGCGSAATSTLCLTNTTFTYESVKSLGTNVSNPLPPSTTRMMCGVSLSLRSTSKVCTGRPATVPPNWADRSLASLINYTSAADSVAGYVRWLSFQ